MYFPRELGDLWSSKSWVGLEVILMFSSLLQFCFGEQFPSVYFLSFLLFPAARQLSIMQCHNKRISAKSCIFHSNRSACTDGGGERPLPPSWNRALSGRDSNSTGKGQRFAVHKGKGKNNTKKATEESSRIRYSSLAPFISATEKQKQQPLHPKGSLSIRDSFQKAFYIPSSPSDVLMGFSLVLLPSNYQKLSWERCVRCGSSASLPAGSWGAAEEYVPPHGDALRACSLPVPRLAMAATAATAACASPSRAAGAGKQRRGGSRRNADLTAPPGDFELTSGGCRVRQLENQAGCAWLLQEVPDLALLPLLKCSCSFFSPPPSPLVASSAIKAQFFPSCKKLPF